VDAAVHKGAGPQLLEALKYFNGCKTGEAVLTKAFNLKARYIIHAVGPVYKDGGKKEAALLYSAYKNSIRLCKSVDIKSVLFPVISSGVYGYPLEEACRIALDSIETSCKEYDFKGKVAIVCFDEITFSLFNSLQQN
tara:strand:+ start:2302 stop:2712 length:411 start_codon:yes stop_codon:yes gene_type:complete